MQNVIVVVVIAIVAYSIILVVRRNRGSLVGKRGLSIGADLGAMGDAPRVLVREVTKTGPDQVHVLLAPDPVARRGDDDGPTAPSDADLDLVVRLEEGDFGLGLLHEWQRTESPLAMVVPPASRLVRLRSLNDLQHLTLRRCDD